MFVVHLPLGSPVLSSADVRVTPKSNQTYTGPNSVERQKGQIASQAKIGTPCSAHSNNLVTAGYRVAGPLLGTTPGTTPVYSLPERVSSMSPIQNLVLTVQSTSRNRIYMHGAHEIKDELHTCASIPWLHRQAKWSTQPISEDQA